jgi:ABC-type glycerol-3-phosphate transport system permease component
MKKQHQEHPAYQINFKRIFIKSTILAFGIVALVLCLGVLVGYLLGWVW